METKTTMQNCKNDCKNYVPKAPEILALTKEQCEYLYKQGGRAGYRRGSRWFYDSHWNFDGIPEYYEYGLLLDDPFWKEWEEMQAKKPEHYDGEPCMLPVKCGYERHAIGLRFEYTGEFRPAKYEEWSYDTEGSIIRWLFKTNDWYWILRAIPIEQPKYDPLSEFKNAVDKPTPSIRTFTEEEFKRAKADKEVWERVWLNIKDHEWCPPDESTLLGSLPHYEYGLLLDDPFFQSKFKVGMQVKVNGKRVGIINYISGSTLYVHYDNGQTVTHASSECEPATRADFIVKRNGHEWLAVDYSKAKRVTVYKDGDYVGWFLNDSDFMKLLKLPVCPAGLK